MAFSSKRRRTVPETENKDAGAQDNDAQAQQTEAEIAQELLQNTFSINYEQNIVTKSQVSQAPNRSPRALELYDVVSRDQSYLNPQSEDIDLDDENNDQIYAHTPIVIKTPSPGPTMTEFKQPPFDSIQSQSSKNKKKMTYAEAEANFNNILNQ